MKPHNNNPAATAKPGWPPATLETEIKGELAAILKLEVDLEELNYIPIPPKNTRTISVRYRIRGRGQPLPFS